MTEETKLCEFEPFNLLPPEIIDKILNAATIRTYPAHNHVFNQNDPFTGNLYVIKRGLVEITLLTPSGEDIVVDYRHAGETFGSTPVFTNEAYTGGSRTVQQTQCYLIPQEILVETAKKYPDFKNFFDQKNILRVRDLYADIIADYSQKALISIEAYPFQKRLSEVMNTPVIQCHLNTSAHHIARQMANNQIRSIVVTNDKGELLGLVTCKDIISKVTAVEGANPEKITAKELMTTKPYTMIPETFMYEAMAHMVVHHLKYLPIVSEGSVVGMVTMSDLMRYRSQKAMLMIGSIEETTNFQGLTAIHHTLVRVANALLSENRSAPEVMEILSYIHHALIKRTYHLCWEQMLCEGFTPPNINYCFLIMGSGGRREMMLGPDQDNGFIYENFPDAMQAEVDAFFVPFADKLTHALNKVGYPLCKGNVMVSNEVWRGRLCDWEKRVENWAENPDPFKVRYSSIFFDFTPLIGDLSLAHSLQSIVFKAISDYPYFLYQVMQLNLTHKVPTGLWGRFTTEKSGDNKGKLSLKNSGLIYIVDCLRMFALENETRTLTSMGRLKQLTGNNVFSSEAAEHIRVAFEALTFLRLRNEIYLVQNGYPPSSYIDPYELTKTEQDLLRSAFQAVSKLQSVTRIYFTKGLF